MKSEVGSRDVDQEYNAIPFVVLWRKGGGLIKTGPNREKGLNREFTVLKTQLNEKDMIMMVYQ